MTPAASAAIAEPSGTSRSGGASSTSDSAVGAVPSLALTGSHTHESSSCQPSQHLPSGISPHPSLTATRLSSRALDSSDAPLGPASDLPVRILRAVTEAATATLERPPTPSALSASASSAGPRPAITPWPSGTVRSPTSSDRQAARAALRAALTAAVAAHGSTAASGANQPAESSPHAAHLACCLRSTGSSIDHSPLEAVQSGTPSPSSPHQLDASPSPPSPLSPNRPARLLVAEQLHAAILDAERTLTSMDLSDTSGFLAPSNSVAGADDNNSSCTILDVHKALMEGLDRLAALERALADESDGPEHSNGASNAHSVSEQAQQPDSPGDRASNASTQTAEYNAVMSPDTAFASPMHDTTSVMLSVASDDVTPGEKPVRQVDSSMSMHGHTPDESESVEPRSPWHASMPPPLRAMGARTQPQPPEGRGNAAPGRGFSTDDFDSARTFLRSHNSAEMRVYHADVFDRSVMRRVCVSPQQCTPASAVRRAASASGTARAGEGGIEEMRTAVRAELCTALMRITALPIVSESDRRASQDADAAHARNGASGDASLDDSLSDWTTGVDASPSRGAREANGTSLEDALADGPVQPASHRRVRARCALAMCLREAASHAEALEASTFNAVLMVAPNCGLSYLPVLYTKSVLIDVLALGNTWRAWALTHHLRASNGLSMSLIDPKFQWRYRLSVSSLDEVLLHAVDAVEKGRGRGASADGSGHEESDNDAGTGDGRSEIGAGAQGHDSGDDEDDDEDDDAFDVAPGVPTVTPEAVESTGSEVVTRRGRPWLPAVSGRGDIEKEVSRVAHRVLSAVTDNRAELLEAAADAAASAGGGESPPSLRREGVRRFSDDGASPIGGDGGAARRPRPQPSTASYASLMSPVHSPRGALARCMGRVGSASMRTTSRTRTRFATLTPVSGHLSPVVVRSPGLLLGNAFQSEPSLYLTLTQQDGSEPLWRGDAVARTAKKVGFHRVQLLDARVAPVHATIVAGDCDEDTDTARTVRQSLLGQAETARTSQGDGSAPPARETIGTRCRSPMKASNISLGSFGVRRISADIATTSSGGGITDASQDAPHNVAAIMKVYAADGALLNGKFVRPGLAVLLADGDKITLAAEQAPAEGVASAMRSSFTLPALTYIFHSGDPCERAVQPHSYLASVLPATHAIPLCQICRDLPRRSVELSPCGHLFCAACLSHTFALWLLEGRPLGCPHGCDPPRMITPCTGVDALMQDLPQYLERLKGVMSFAQDQGAVIGARTSPSAGSPRSPTTAASESAAAAAPPESDPDVAAPLTDAAEPDAAAHATGASGSSLRVFRGSSDEDAAEPDACRQMHSSSEPSPPEPLDATERADTPRAVNVHSLVPLSEEVLPLSTEALVTQTMDLGLRRLHAAAEASVPNLAAAVAGARSLVRAAAGVSVVQDELGNGGAIEDAAEVLRRATWKAVHCCSGTGGDAAAAEAHDAAHAMVDIVTALVVNTEVPVDEVCQSNQWRAARAGFVEAMLAALRTWPESTALAFATVQCLLVLCRDNVMMKAHVTVLAVPQLLQALDGEMAACMPFVERTFVLFGVLQAGGNHLNDGVRRVLVEQRALKAAVRVLRRRAPGDERVLTAVCFAFAMLLRGGPAWRRTVTRLVARTPMLHEVERANTTYVAECHQASVEVDQALASLLLFLTYYLRPIYSNARKRSRKVAVASAVSGAVVTLLGAAARGRLR